MSYTKNYLLPDEEILYRGHRHWIIFFQPLFWLIVSMFCFWKFPWGLNEFAYVPLVLAGITGINAVIDYMMTEISVTNMRVLVKVGLIARSSVETPIKNIASIQINQTFLGRILGYGTIIICDTGNMQSVYNRIDSPFLFRRVVQKQIDRKSQS